MDPTLTHMLLPRQSGTASSGDSTSNDLLKLLADPFAGTLASDAVIASLVTNLVLTILLALFFCILRPYNNVVYAPRAKHADSKHAPPPIDKGFFGWIPPLMRTKEQDLVDKVGLDAAVFMRFARMMRNIFLALTILGCGVLIPVYLTQNVDYGASGSTSGSQTTRQSGGGTTSNTSDDTDDSNSDNAWLVKLTPQSMYGKPAFWALVVCAWLFDAIICFFLWYNYRAVLRMRRAYFHSHDYQRGLHARTLLLTDIPTDLRTDDGILRITDDVRATQAVPRAAIARNVKDLPDLIEEHEKAVRALEGYLAKYLKNPDKLPEKRPMCKASKSDKAYTKGHRVDAIEYWTARIKELEIEVKEVRESIDKRNALSYGFASYENIPEAHTVAYVARKTGPKGTIIRLAPKPHDLVWKNLKMSKKERSWQNFINNLWVALLTLVWVVPNVLIAIFLANLSHLGQFWPGFQTVLYASPKFWAVVQGVLAPAITSLFYFVLPAIFRRLATSAGDVTKTSRDRHVMSMLYGFFVLNNLIVVSIFAALFGWISYLVNTSKTDKDTWGLIRDSGFFTTLITSLCQVSPYWLTFLVQRNLGAAVDLSQIFNLAWGSFSRRFRSPTPRQLIELSAPQPFDYAGYYNYFLFYATIALCFATIQPLVLPVTAVYFWLDSWLKKYLVLYVFVTKYESGGMFWRTLFNRVLFMTILANVIVALILVAYSVSSLGTNVPNIAMLSALGPLPFLIVGFKFYCQRAFDTQMRFYQTGKAMQDVEETVGEHKSRKHDRVGVRFGHPALYKPLMTPMVSAKTQHLLKQIYSGRTSVDETRTTAGYSDVYMEAMDATKPGKSAGAAPFEIVNENDMDFEHFKNRADFREQAGGDGELYGRAGDMVRSDTPNGSISGLTRAGTMDTFGSRSRSESRNGRGQSADSDSTRVGEAGGVEYPRGYHKTPSGLREHSPADSDFSGDFGSRPRPARLESRERLVGAAAGMGHGRNGSRSYAITPGSTSGDEDTSYDYFRRGRNL